MMQNCLSFRHDNLVMNFGRQQTNSSTVQFGSIGIISEVEIPLLMWTASFWQHRPPYVAPTLSYVVEDEMGDRAVSLSRLAVLASFVMSFHAAICELNQAPRTIQNQQLWRLTLPQTVAVPHHREQTSLQCWERRNMNRSNTSIPEDRVGLRGFGAWDLTRRTRRNARNRTEHGPRSGWRATRRLSGRDVDLGRNKQIEIFTFLPSLIFELSNSFNSVTKLEWS
jgi:hypothetical protein